MNFDVNKVKITGKMASDLVFSHTAFNEDFYSFNLNSKRLSEENDTVPILISEKLLYGFSVGDTIKIDGQIRSHSDGKGKRSKTSVFVIDLEKIEEMESDINEVSFIGFVCKDPVYRKTPLGRDITDLLIAINRAHQKSDYAQCIAWGRNAKFAKNFSVGQKIKAKARFQSRFYNKKLDNGQFDLKMAHELSITDLSIVEEGE